MAAMMAAMNKSYMSMYDTIDQATITKGQLQSTLLKLKENEDLIKRMEAIKVAQVEELFRLRKENKKLKGELRSRDKRIETLGSNTADLIDKVMNVEARAWAIEEYLKEAELARDDEIARAAEEAVVTFKQSEEFVALLKKEHDEGYDIDIEEIFFNIWVKRRDVDYKFLGGELVKLMDQWLEEERLGTSTSRHHLHPLIQ